MHHCRLYIQVAHLLHTIEAQYPFVTNTENRSQGEIVQLLEKTRILHKLHRKQCPCSTT